MAKTYTYDDFVNAANGAGMLNTFSQEDLSISQRNPEYGLSLLKLQQDAAKATTSEQKLLAQEAVNQLRKTYSVLPTAAASTAETAGSAVEPAASSATSAAAKTAKTAKTAKGYSYAGESVYQDALQNVTNYNPYSYSYSDDPIYGTMRDSYLSDNKTTAGQVLSSPAVSQTSVPAYGAAASGQSANYYAAKLNDIIPQLEQSAYERYLKEFELLNSQLDAAAADKADDYDRWATAKELEAAAVQQQFANDLALSQMFGLDAPGLPDLGSIGSGSSSVPKYSYEKQNEYAAALEAVLNNPEFSYLLANDPQYSSLRKSFLREGSRATEDALARASAGSMGVPSSYAIRLASDSGNAYNEQLMNAVPGLQENAFGRHLNDFQKNLSAFTQLSEDRALNYAQWLQNYQFEQKMKQQKFDNAVSLYMATGQLTPEIAAALGIPYEESAGYYDDSSYYGVVGGNFGDTLDAAIKEAQRNNPYLANGKADQSGLNYSINQAINQAQSSGQITSSQAAALKQEYIGKVGGFALT